ncbi:MAG TPA: hypothetical protein VFK03_04160 [Candidatus Saccharimonadales bacterium]|nr:hypothetical protein [Candidatus Saccharimonadales bacterium]
MAKRFAVTTYYKQVFGSRIGLAAVSGLLTGFVIWLINLLLQNFLFQPLFCQSPDTHGACLDSNVWSWWIAAVIVSLASLMVLVKGLVYRPLLVVLASLVTVWGIWDWLGVFSWWQASLWEALIFGLAYALYTLLARINNFALSLLAIVVSIIVVRLVSLLA